MIVITNYTYSHTDTVHSLKKKKYTMTRSYFYERIHTNVPTSNKAISQR